jgi:hypothetical protein
MMEEDRREQSEQPSDQVKFVNMIVEFMILTTVSIFQENKSCGIRPFALILCLPVAVHTSLHKQQTLSSIQHTHITGHSRQD